MNGINESFTQFRFLLYQHFNNRADACLELVDAISADCQASSVPELSLSHLFRRNYSSLYKAIADYEPKEAKFNLAQLSAPFIPLPLSQPFYLLGVDVTPQPRPYAYTLSNRECIYQSQPVKSNKPITFGHAYSSVFALPERKDRLSPHWVIPLSTCRVHRIDKEETGARQVRELLQDHTLPFHERLCVEVTDCAYSKPAYLAANRDQANLITITRSRTNRVFYRQPEKLSSHGRGHALWYGSKFSLRDPQTWSAPDETTSMSFTNHQGKVYLLQIEAWVNMLMRGKYKRERLPMQKHPFTLLRVRQYNEEGKQVFAHPLWLIVMGKERGKLSPPQIQQAYSQRYDVEHFFRFGKQKMLLSGYQTPETEHEEKWWQLVHLAYLQLWVAKEQAMSMPRPWEKYLPVVKTGNPSPSMVQRELGRIIGQLEKIARMPKLRGNSPGRTKGMKGVVREKKPIQRSG